MTTLNALLDRSAQEGGERTALVLGDHSLTFAGVRREALSVAEGLRQAGISRGDRVAIIHRNAPEFVVAYFALVRLGAIAVPINFMVSKPDELAYMLNDCGAVGVVTQKEFLPGLTLASAKCPALKALWTTDFDAGEAESGIVRGYAGLRKTPPEDFPRFLSGGGQTSGIPRSHAFWK